MAEIETSPDGSVWRSRGNRELFARGGNVAAGYWHNEAATAATFVDG
ncbi:MAG: hypothetical protein R3F38_16500 [Gammaproteobacteria bacterium]